MQPEISVSFITRKGQQEEIEKRKGARWRHQRFWLRTTSGQSDRRFSDNRYPMLSEETPKLSRAIVTILPSANWYWQSFWFHWSTWTLVVIAASATPMQESHSRREANFIQQTERHTWEHQWTACSVLTFGHCMKDVTGKAVKSAINVASIGIITSKIDL